MRLLGLSAALTGLVLMVWLYLFGVVLQLLGLLLPKYVPDESSLHQPSWVGVLQNADALVPMLQQHVIEPLMHGKQKRPNTHVFAAVGSGPLPL